MRAVFLALGSRGDTEPCLALGSRLRRRGHEVDVVAAERYRPAVLAAGVGHRPLTGDPAEIMASEAGQALLASGPLGLARGIRSLIAPLAEQLLRDAAAAARGADVIVAPPIGGLGRHLSEAFGMPHVLLHFQPSEPTGQFPNPLLGPRRLGPWLNRRSYLCAEMATELVVHVAANRARREVLGLPPLRRGTVHLDRAAGVPVLCPISPLVQPRPRDWPANVHLTGSWSSPSTPLPAATTAFLDAGPAPVYVGFGSMVAERPDELAATVVAAARQLGARLIVQGLPVRETRGVHRVDDVDHEALFARCAAVVHHGGAGTTTAGLRSGVPSLVCPFFGDQPYWAGRVAALGVGPAPVRVHDLTVEALARSLRRALRDRAMRERAAVLGARLAAEDGVGVAADLVEDHVAGAIPQLGAASARRSPGRRVGLSRMSARAPR